MKPWYAACLGLLSLGGAFCGGVDSDPSEKYQAPRRSGTFSFDVYVDANTIHLVLAEYDGASKAPELHHRRSEDGGESWSEPVRIDENATPAYLP